MGTTATSGLSNDPATWVGGVVPTTTTPLVIAHPGTNTFGSTPYLTTGALAINATSIPVSGGSGSIVAGECIQLEHQTGTDADGFPVWHTTYYRVATGITGNGTIVIDAPGLQIAIPAGTRVLNCGHVVTLSADHTWGNDTAGGFTVNGTIRWPDNASRTLTVRANYAVNASGTEDRGEPDRPIPQGVDAVLRPNDSATLGVGKYGITYAAGCRVRQFGAARTRYTTTTAAATVGATSVSVTAATGWQVGDEIVILPTATANNYNVFEVRTIAAGYTPGSLTVPISSGLTYAKTGGANVMNLTSNVVTREVNTSFGANTYAFQQSAAGRLLDKRLRHSLIQNSNAGFLESITFDSGGEQGRVQQQAFADCAFSVSGNFRGLKLNGGVQALRFALFGRNNATRALNVQSARITDALVAASEPLNRENASTGSSIVRRAMFFGYTPFGAGHLGRSVGGLVEDCDFYNASSESPRPGEFQALGGIVRRLRISPFSVVYANAPDLRPVTRYEQCDWRGAPDFVPTYGSFFGQRIENWSAIYATDTPRTEAWENEGYYRSVSDVRRNGRTAMRLTNNLTLQGQVNPLRRAFQVNLPASSTRLILVNLRRSSSGSMPVVTISGPGITTVTSSVPNTADTWHTASLSVINPTSELVQAEVAYTVAGAVGTNSWVDGTPDFPYIQTVRWYGYEFDESNPFRVLDPTITLSEAAAAAVTGVSINHTTGAISVTAPVTAAQFYCFAMLDLVNNLDGSGNYRTRHITSSGGVVTTTYTVTLSGAGAISGGQIVAANGATGLISITGLTGGSANAQIWVGNDAGVQQDFQPSVTGSYSYSIPFGATGVWKVVVNKPGYFPQIFNITPGQTTALNISLEPILNPDGTVLYTGASAPISATFVTAGDYDLHFGTEVTIQQIFDSSQDAYSTAAGMAWLGAGNSELRVIKTNIGQFAFLPLRTRLFGTALPAAVAGFVTSEDDTVQDPATTFPIRFAQPPASGATAAELVAALIAADPPIPVDLRRVRGIVVDGTGTESDPWGPV